MMPGVSAQQSYANTSLPDFNDVVFQSTLEGSHLGTDAVDVSNLAAPLTFHGSAALSNEQATLGLSTSLKLTGTADFVRAPANVLYNLGSGPHFTIECAFRTPSFDTGAGQIVGVWNTPSGVFQWRIVIDSLRLYFQARRDGLTVQYSITHNFLANTWYWIAVCRYLSTLRFFAGAMSAPTAPMVSKREPVTGTFDTPGTPQPLDIGGSNGAEGCLAYLQMLRLTREARYRTDDAIDIPTEALELFGPIEPPIIIDFEDFPIHRIGQVLPGTVVEGDIYLPTLVANPGAGGAIPTQGATSVTSITPLLVGTLLGDMIISFVQCTDGGKTFSVGGGWTIGDTATGANSSTAWAWRLNDGTQAAPVWSWSGATNARAKTYRIRNPYPSQPLGIGNKLASFGESTNLLINSGVGLTTVGPMSMVMAMTLLSSSNQTIPAPSGFIQIDSFGFTTPSGNLNGSDRASYAFINAAGGVSSPVNLTIASARWHGFLIEIKKA